MRRKDSFALKSVGGDYLLVPLGAEVKARNGLVTLNATAAYLWGLLAADRSLEDLTAAAAAQFDLIPSRAAADVRSFVELMSDAGLIEP